MMYSLYRAWFGDGAPGDNYSRLQETLSPPDTVIRVGNEGEHQFVAHKGVLAAHSGYLKALLTSAATTPNQSVSTNIGSCSNLPATAIAVTTNISEQSLRQPVTSVSVSSIGGEAFAPLLNYMYTGRLEVTMDNVYSVLLATHLLHMPGALEQCRAALFRLRAPAPLPTPIPVPAVPTSTLTSTSMSSSTPGSGNILRPIPNRLMIDPTMCWPATQFYQPTAPHLTHLSQLQPSVLMQSTVPLNVSVVPSSSVQDTQNSTRYSEVSSPKSSVYQSDRNRSHREPKQKPQEDVSSVFSAAFTAFSASTSTASPTRSVSPTSSPTSQSSLPASQAKKSSSTNQRQGKEEDYEQSKSTNRQTQDHASSLTPLEESTSNRHRERAAESLSIAETDRGRSKRRGRGSNGNESSSSGVLSVVYDVACCDGPVRFHRVLNENYSSASCGTSTIPPSRLQRPCFEPENVASENDENGGPGPGVRTPCDPVEASIETANNSGSYTCGYCRHTFKSQYCYRKHAKRHLLSSRSNNSAGNRQRQEVARNKREVKLLDLNVQYYPCKICGCKFPSYYFVHKHRKLCHANVEERSQNDEAGGNPVEDQESTTSTTNERQ